MTASIKELCKFQTKVIQETLETKVVAQCNTKRTIIFSRPVFHDLLLCHSNRNISKTLICCIEFMCEGSNWLTFMLPSKINIGCSNKGRTHGSHTTDHIIFPFTRNSTANREVCNREIDASTSCRINLSNFLIQCIASLFKINLFISHPKCLNDMKNIDFKRRNIFLWTFSFNKQCSILLIRIHLDVSTL